MKPNDRVEHVHFVRSTHTGEAPLLTPHAGRQSKAVRMSWNLLFYGSLYPSKTRRIAVNALTVCTVLAAYGLWTDFVPSATWSRIGSGLALILSGGVSIYICHGYMSGRIPYGPTATTGLRRGLALSMLAAVIFGLTWVVVVRSIPDLSIRWREPSQIVTVVLRKEKSYSRRTCDNKITGDYLGFFPGHVCVSNSAFNLLPEHGPMTIRGSSSVFGIHIQSIEPASADKLLEAHPRRGV